MRSYFLVIFLSFSLIARPKVLHLTLHRGCQNEIQRIAEHFD